MLHVLKLLLLLLLRKESMQLTNLTTAKFTDRSVVGRKSLYRCTMITHHEDVIHFTLTRLVLLLYVRSALLIFNRLVAISFDLFDGADETWLTVEKRLQGIGERDVAVFDSEQVISTVYNSTADWSA